MSGQFRNPQVGQDELIETSLLSVDGIRPNKCFMLCSVVYGQMTSDINIQYILESNPRLFLQFQRAKIWSGLDSRCWAGFWKNDRAAVRAVRAIQYNNLLFYVLFVIYYIIFIMYYSSDSPSSLITESVCLVGKGRLKERCGLEPRTDFFFFV